MKHKGIKIRGHVKKVYVTFFIFITIISVSGVVLSEGNSSLNQSYSWTGHGGYEAKGIGMGIVNPSTGAVTLTTWGNITLSQIPSGSTIEKAFLYWAGGGTDTSCSLNGNNVTGTIIGKDSVYPYWYMRRADVTNLVSGNGLYSITQLSATGSSLVAIYSNVYLPLTSIFIANGADNNGDFGSTGWMTPVTFSGLTIQQNSSVQITYIIGDGQPYETYCEYEPVDKYSFNGNVIAVNAADGSDDDGYGARLWDTDTYNVSTYVNPGDTYVTMNVDESTYQGDDLGWTAAILSICNMQSQPEPTVDLTINDDIIFSNTTPTEGMIVTIQATVYGDKTLYSNATQPELIFDDNFDAGNLNKWSIGSWNPCGVCEVTTEVSHSPNYSFHSQSDPDTNTAPTIYKWLVEEYTQIKFETWFYLPSKTQPYSDFLIGMLSNLITPPGGGDLFPDYDFIISLSDDDYGIDIKERALENGSWVESIEKYDVYNLTSLTWNHVCVDINENEFTLLINDNIIFTGFRVNNKPIDVLLLGDTGGSSGGTNYGWGNAYWDDLKIWNTTTQCIIHQGLNATCDVNFYMDSVTPANLIGAVTHVFMPTNDQVVVGINWTAVSGSHNIIVDVTSVNPEDSNLSNNQALKSITIVGNTTATATGPQGAHHDPVITITYNWTGTPTAVDLYYSLNAGDNWNHLGTDTSVDGYYDWTPESEHCPKPHKLYWIANAQNGTDDVGIPADGTPPEAGPFNWKTWDIRIGASQTFSVDDNNWYFVSIPLNISGDVLTVFNDVNWGDGGTSWDYIQWYDATDSVRPWKSYSIYRPPTLNDEIVIDNTKGIWIHLICNDGDGALTVGEGKDPVSTPINLHAGWNLVGYPSLNYTRTVGDALWGTGADKVEVFDPLSPYRTKEVDSSHLMMPGEGYWIHVPADTFWIVDW
jgi:hypothetical protein